MARHGTPKYRSFATGSKPSRSMAAAIAASRLKPGKTYSIIVRHDNDCPALETQAMNDCTCEIADLDTPEELTP